MPSANRIALNRVTFGARDLDENAVNLSGWQAWVESQLNAPPGDDADLAEHLAAQTMRINYAAANIERPRETWAALDEMRHLNYINLSPADLWTIHRNAGSSLSPSERTRVRQELATATWIRNAHSRYQLREFMVDFWHNHFNISKNEAEGATVLLPAFDRLAIRANAFGNFRTMLEATATSGAMLIYLDNYLSTSTTPNENYAREIMELHTLGGEAYLGVGDTGPVPVSSMTGVPIGFTDQDVLQASRALSGWTIQYGQRGPGALTYPNSGEFVYNSRQHNTAATSILGRSLANMTGDMAQGRAVLDTIASHPATARHVIGRLMRRIFGDRPPTPAYERALAAFTVHRDAPDQIARVLRAILIDGEDVFSAPVAKVRRPYERILALLRTTDMVLTAGTTQLTALDRLTDALFAWPAPDGRPDFDSYWLATGANLTTWNLLFQVPAWREVQTTLTAQTPLSAAESATATVEYWVNRMIGGRLSTENMNLLIGDQAGTNGAPTAVRARRSAATIESAYRRLVSLIATTEAFSVR
jgi:uncharacterized protein (DUF1800 family)